MRVGIKYGCGANNNPCFECKDRHIGCHGSCEKYQAQRKEWNRIIENRQKETKKIRDYCVATNVF